MGKIVMVVSALLAFVLPSLVAQGTTGTLSGTVKDTTGAVLPGVEIRLKHPATGTTRAVISDEEGRYRVSNLPLGSYEIEASLVGFRTEVRSGIVLTIGREAVVAFTMNLGEITERVMVTGEAALVETTSSSLNALVDEKKMRDLPLNGRDITQLALIQPGVALVTNATTSPTTGKGKQIAISGSRPNQNSYMLDGMDIKNSTGKAVGGAAGVLLGVESIREFTVLRGNYSAEYGRSAGGVVNAVTKSGTNEFHGALFEFHRNDNLDARNFFAKDKPEFRRNQFGGTLGGPILKNRTFFFFGYEGFREALGDPKIAFVPSVSARNGVLSGGTVSVDPRIRPLLDRYPLPNSPGRSADGGEFRWNYNQVTHEDQFVIRADHNFGNNDSLFGRYVRDTSEEVRGQGEIPQYADFNTTLRNQYFIVEHKKFFPAGMVNIAKLAVNRSVYAYFQPIEDPLLRWLPRPRNIGGVEVSGLSSIGGAINTPANIPLNVITVADDVLLTQGPHAIKTGFLLMRYQENILRDFRANGRLIYPSLRDYLLNQPSRLEIGMPQLGVDPYKGFRESLIGMYVQDDYKFRSSLTLNLGLRYEFITNPTEVNNKMAVIVNPLTDANGTIAKTLFKKNPSLKNWAPRMGLAYDPFGKGRTVIRSGFGLFYDQILPYQYDAMQWNPPLFVINDLGAAQLRSQNVQYPVDPLRLSTALPALSPYTADYDNENTGYVMQYNLELQQQLGQTVVTVAYVGNRGAHLGGNSDVNSAIPVIDPQGQKFHPPGSARRNRNFGRTSVIKYNRDSWYNSLQTNVQRRFQGGFQFQTSYIWSSTIDTGSHFVNADFGGGFLPQDPYNLAAEKGLTPFHTRHYANFNVTYDLPFGKNQNGFLKHLLAGWQVNNITGLASGTPVSITMAAFNRSRSGVNEDRPNLRPGASNSPVLGGPDRYFDPTAFELQPAGYFGNLGRRTLIGPGRVSVDFSVTKNFELTEGKRLQFRSEFFNIPNRTNFHVPSASVFDSQGRILPTAGRIRETTTTARQIQFGLKFVF
ncbi:MAG: carboxypeptidase regulatory-like domain-containing protein [Acidobacteria bacterium]|nr:carboxypeptidase regulatory-like domain-containing protein [Acidobacteriota bacterium]